MEVETKPVSENTVDSEASKNTKTKDNSSSTKIILIVVAVILLLAGLVYLFIRLGPDTTASIRDIMLIIFALESVVTVAAVVVLCVNTAKLINFLKYEIQPILNTTGKTIKKVSGTVSFLCENAVEPTVNVTSTVSGIKSAANTVLSLFKK